MGLELEEVGDGGGLEVWSNKSSNSRSGGGCAMSDERSCVMIQSVRNPNC